MPLSPHMDAHGVTFHEFLKAGASVDLSDVDVAALAAADGNVINYDYVAADDEFAEVMRVNFRSEDDSKGGPNTFFGIAALSSGLLIQVLDEADAIVEQFHTDEIPIKKHNDLILWAGIDVDPDSSANISAIGVRWTIDKAGKPFLLRPGWTFRVVVRDALSTLARLNIMIQGATAHDYVFHVN